MVYAYQTLEVTQRVSVVEVTINNPPLNVMTLQLYSDLVEFTEKVEHDDSVKVIIFQSANPDFFIAHFDVEAILEFPTDSPAKRSEKLSDFHLMCERVRTMPKATIAKIAGRAGGGGNEFAASCDMRFGLLEKTIINQMEVALGILPGGTGTQSLPRLIGRGRAMEVCLGCDDLDAKTAESWGYLNRAFNSKSKLDEFITNLADRISSWPIEAISRCKASINNSETSWQDGLVEEAFLFQETLRTKTAQTNMRTALNLGLQTFDGETNMGQLCLEFGRAAANKR
ncbi:MAG: enoyl-CoA hydratase/isomerase family protein [Candidatus Azotimanducaceae bacterium]